MMLTPGWDARIRKEPHGGPFQEDGVESYLTIAIHVFSRRRGFTAKGAVVPLIDLWPDNGRMFVVPAA